MEQATKTRRKAPRRKTRLPDGELKQRRDTLAAVAADKAAWEKACNEVTASILSDQVHKTRGHYLVDPKLVDKAMHDRVPDAKKELGAHRVGDVGCMCRHHAIITVGANQQSRLTGAHPGIFFDGARAVLDAYLSRRS